MMSKEKYMRRAIELAMRGCGTVSPNPMVGCVIVKNQEIIAEAWHKKAGEAHAEILALQQAGENANGASLFVNLEPCSHYGRTSPCVDAIISAKIKAVYIPFIDPNPKVSGEGVKALKAAGIGVHIGLCKQEARNINAVFLHYIQIQQPYVIAKWGMSLDGKTITHANDSRQITNQTSQRHVHGWREQCDAILIGSQTALKDDPMLTVRYSDSEPAKQPLRIVLTTSALPINLKLFHGGKTLVTTTESIDINWMQQLLEKGVEVCVLPKNDSGKVDLHHLMKYLGKRNITSLYVEGGRTVHEAFLSEGLVNKVCVYLASNIIGNLTEKQSIEISQQIVLDGDYYFEGVL